METHRHMDRAVAFKPQPATSRARKTSRPTKFLPRALTSLNFASSSHRHNMTARVKSHRMRRGCRGRVIRLHPDDTAVVSREDFRLYTDHTAHFYGPIPVSGSESCTRPRPEQGCSAGSGALRGAVPSFRVLVQYRASFKVY